KVLRVGEGGGGGGGGTVPSQFEDFNFSWFSPLIPENLHPSPSASSSSPSSVSPLYLKALGTNSSIEPYLSGIKAGLLSGRATSPAAAFAPGLRKYPQEGAKPSLTPSSSQAKALLVSLSASGLSAEALLLSSTLRHRRLLREQQRASSLPLPSSRSSPTTPTASSPSSSSSPTTPTPSLSPSSPTSWGSLALSPAAAAPKPSGCSSSLNSRKEGGGEHVTTDLAAGNSR
ncbi:uncharacterized protein, partial [Cebidichthys violaceus]|uniref:uncharacterized protein n=1 Tax=Cebidichthys violaceus TaxID=271503 RepID=UPI0035CB9586